MSSASASEPGPRWRSVAAVLLLIAAVSYNLPLSIINAHGFGIGRNALIACEIAIIGTTLMLVASQWRAEMTRWALMIGTFVLISMLLTLLRQGFDPKSLRDMLMMATFVMLGMTVRETVARPVFVWLQLVILAVMLVEVSVPDFWSQLVDSRDYFISTRGFSPDQFYGDLELFGASRGDERYFLPFLGWNRASSIFLEPLSLGNYCSFSVLMMLLFWRDWRWRTRLAMLVSWAVLLVGSDSRFAGASSVALLIATPIVTRLPVMLSVFYLPLSILGARIVSQALAWNPLDDDFPGRIARGMKQLFRLDRFDLAGFSVPTPALADSGISYLVMSQSLAGVVVMQAFLYVMVRPMDPRQRLVVHGTAISFALSILISISMLSIKTAAFYWFYVGVILYGPMAAKRPAGSIAGGPYPRSRGLASA